MAKSQPKKQLGRPLAVGKKRLDQLSPDKVRVSIAIRKTLRQKLEKLAKAQHVSLTGCIVGLLESAYEDRMALSTIMGNSAVRHAIMAALDNPNFFKLVGGHVADAQAEERSQQTLFPLLNAVNPK